jgi:hypothetical protein
MGRAETYWVLSQHVTITHATPSYSLVDVVAPPLISGPPPHRGVTGGDVQGRMANA